jgi:hypothetical protein
MPGDIGDALMTATTNFALFRDGKQITKAHSTRHAVITEAYERNIVQRTTPDFGSNDEYAWLPDEYEIKEVS